MSSSSTSSSSSSSSTPTPPDITGGQASFFATGASPPLIIGFIALGTFALGIIAICGWRRVTGRTLLTPEALRVVHQRRRARRGDEVGEKPELFDLWVEGPGAGDTKWRDIMPVSSIVYDDEAIPDTPSSDMKQSQRNINTTKGHRTDGNAIRDAHSSLQVAVVLAMPSPNRDQWKKDTKALSGSDSDEYQEVPPYSIGLTRIPWAGGLGDGGGDKRR